MSRWYRCAVMSRLAIVCGCLIILSLTGKCIPASSRDCYPLTPCLSLYSTVFASVRTYVLWKQNKYIFVLVLFLGLIKPICAIVRTSNCQCVAIMWLTIRDSVKSVSYIEDKTTCTRSVLNAQLLILRQCALSRSYVRRYTQHNTVRVLDLLITRVVLMLMVYRSTSYLSPSLNLAPTRLLSLRLAVKYQLLHIRVRRLRTDLGEDDPSTACAEKHQDWLEAKPILYHVSRRSVSFIWPAPYQLLTLTDHLLAQS